MDFFLTIWYSIPKWVQALLKWSLYILEFLSQTKGR